MLMDNVSGVFLEMPQDGSFYEFFLENRCALDLSCLSYRLRLRKLARLNNRHIAILDMLHLANARMFSHAMTGQFLMTQLDFHVTVRVRNNGLAVGGGLGEMVIGRDGMLLGGFGAALEALGATDFPALLDMGKTGASAFFELFHLRQVGHELDKGLNGFHLGSVSCCRRKALVKGLVGDSVKDLGDFFFGHQSHAGDTIVVDGKVDGLIRRMERSCCRR